MKVFWVTESTPFCCVKESHFLMSRTRFINNIVLRVSLSIYSKPLL